MEAINQHPPVDPDGNKVVKDHLIIDKDEIEGMVQRALNNMFRWIASHKTSFMQINEKDSKK